MVMSENILLVDARNLIDRYWYATSDIQKTLNLVNKKIEQAINSFSIKYIMIASDVSQAKTVRHSFYPEYKETREFNEDKDFAVSSIINILSKQYFTIFNERYEADDFIASAVKILKCEDKNIFILSTDKDLYALIDETVFCLDHSKDNKIMNKNNVYDKIGVYPSQITDFLSLMGDASDNIPGATGIGKKTAIKLLNDNTSLMYIYKNLDNLEIKDKLKEKLINEKENIILSFRLVSLIFGLLPTLTLDQLKIEDTINIVVPPSLFHK